MGRILITRPVDDSVELIGALKAKDHETVLSPLLKIEVLKPELPDLSNYSALIFTSSNAVRAFTALSDDRSLPVYNVGLKTSEALEKAGFKDIHTAPNSATELIETLPTVRFDKSVLYCRGQDILHDIKAHTADISVDELVFYRSIRIDKFDEAAEKALKNDEITDIMLFSKRTIDSFFNALNSSPHQKEIIACMTRTRLLCLSSEMVKYASKLSAEKDLTVKWRAILSAKTPTRDGMVDLTDNNNEGESLKMANSKPKPIQNAGQIIERFGGIRPMAAKIDTPVTTVQGWKKRDVIPATRREQILTAAQDNNIDLSDVPETSTTATPLSAKKSSSQNTSKPKSATKKDDVTETKTPSSSVPPVSSIKEDAPTTAKIEKSSHQEILDQIEKKNSKALISSIWITVALVLLGIALAAFLLWPLMKQNSISENPAMVQKIEQLEIKVSDVEEQATFFGGTVSADLEERIRDLQQQAQNIQSKVSDLSRQAGGYTEEFVSANAQPLIDRLEMLEKKVELLSNSGEFSSLITRIQDLEKSLAGQEQLQNSVRQLQMMVQRGGEQGVSDDELVEIQNENRGPLGQTLQGVSNDDLKAAAMLLAFSKFRDSLNREENFEDDLVLLEKLVGQDNPELRASLQRLAPQARDGVLTPQGLSNELRTATGDIVFSSLSGEDVSIKEKAVARLNNVFQVEKEGESVIGTDTQIIVSKAQNLLDEGEVQQAINELRKLDGEAAQTAKPIIDQAQATILAQRVEELVSDTILSKVTGVNLNADSLGNAIENFDIQSIQRNLENTLPEIQTNSGVLRDEESGLTILPQRQNFKGFSGGNRDMQ